MNLTAPITVVIKGKVNTGGKVVFGATISLRRAKGARVITLSGAKAVADKRPGIASLLPTSKVARRRLLFFTGTLRGGDRRPLTQTVLTGTRRGKRTRRGDRVARFRTIPKGNLSKGLKRS